jgi:uncharacterized hydrophobic protein (TIGR00271 family)
MNTDQEKEVIQSQWSELKKSTALFFKRLLSVSDEVDKVSASENIHSDVEFQGFNLWILFCSVLICSIGLNMNSTAVIIGAMLISPLMGPLVGMGFSIGTFDRNLLIKSLKNLANALVISILASYLLFKLAPMSHDQSELLARTRPTLLDLFVALFGGFAGILAATRSIKTNVIPGVAIATALMPPLCTAGYALASSNWTYFFGSIYLFFINAAMIALSALIVVWYLKFPKASYVNKKVQRRGRIYIAVIVLAISVPSILIYVDVLKETIFNNRANLFINECVVDENHKVFDPELMYNENGSYMRVFVYGQDYSEEDILALQEKMKGYNLGNTQLKIENMGSLAESRSMMKNTELEISQREMLIEELQFQILKRNDELEAHLAEIKAFKEQKVDINQLLQEGQLQFPMMESLKYTVEYQSLDSTTGIPTFLVTWKTKSIAKEKIQEFEKLESWLKLRLNAQLDTLQVFALTP